MLTGLSNKDGNRANHEVGVCLPQFVLNVTSTCTLSIRPKYAVGAYISMLVAGKDASGANNVPLASDSAAAVADAVNNRMGYYYLDPVKCPQSYSMKIKGATLLSSGAFVVGVVVVVVVVVIGVGVKRGGVVVRRSTPFCSGGGDGGGGGRGVSVVL